MKPTAFLLQSSLGKTFKSKVSVLESESDGKAVIQAVRKAGVTDRAWGRGF